MPLLTGPARPRGGTSGLPGARYQGGGTTPPQLRLPAHSPACILSPLKVNSDGSRPHSWDFLETKLHLVPLPFLLKLLLLYF